MSNADAPNEVEEEELLDTKLLNERRSEVGENCSLL